MEQFRVGQHVCVKGRGTDVHTHVHTRVRRITATLIVLANGRRFRRAENVSVPYSACGGTTLASECQVQK